MKLSVLKNDLKAYFFLNNYLELSPTTAQKCYRPLKNIEMFVDAQLIA